MKSTVIATKYTTNFVAGPAHPPIMANYAGNGTKSLVQSVESSLKNLQTSYIDVVWPSSAFTQKILSLTPNTALRTLVGLQHLHCGTDAVSQPSRCHGKSSISGCQ
jgi:aryl-alcohol dehydrogenase-like predicted oxidoreductase